jgi:7,8-dihydropterin-6-yl-methyl-4-(beta-D-ribofuranosyl)aminobenzene 5'-phosphate synthase
LISKWGFSCLIEKENSPTILFDTGGQQEALKNNMDELNIAKSKIDEIFISHPHWDHVGGLMEIFEDDNEVVAYVPPSSNELNIKIPPSFSRFYDHEDVININNAREIHKGIYSTGELDNIEQSLVLETDKGLVVIVGCSHPGVGQILEVASQFGELYGIIGGFHGFDDYKKLDGLDLICATHCTQNKSEIKSRYPRQFVKGGIGKVIEI